MRSDPIFIKYGDEKRNLGMSNSRRNLSGPEVLLSVLPILSAFVPLLIYVSFPDSEIVSFLFGGWKILIVLPAVYLTAEYHVRRKLEKPGIKEKQGDD